MAVDVAADRQPGWVSRPASQLQVSAQSAQNEYEQVVFVLRLSRQLSQRYGLSYNYRSARSGIVGTVQQYRQTVDSISLDMVM